MKRLSCIVCVLATMLGPWASTSWGDSHDWISGSGNWSNPANWSPAAVPSTADTARVMSSDATNRTVTLDYTYPDANALAELRVDNAGTGSNTLALGGSYRLAVSQERIGYYGQGKVVQTGGDHVATYHITLGENTGSAGQYDLSGGTLTTRLLHVGNNGTGLFIQNGGYNWITEEMSIAFGSTAGEYVLNDGTLEVNGKEILGDVSGSSALFTQSGGGHSAGGLLMGNDTGAVGSFDLSGGSLNSIGGEYVGFFGYGVFTQTGGTHTAGYLFLGGRTGGTGRYSLSGSGSLSASKYEAIGGFGGTGVFTQSGGTHTILGAGGLQVGMGTGTVDLSGGTLTTPNVYLGGDDVAAGGTGTLNLTGGVMNISGTLNLWTAASSVNLKGGTLNVPTIQIEAGTFSAYGTLANTTINNAGTLQARWGNLILNPATLTNTGTFANAANAALFVQTPTFVNAGNVTVNAGGGVSFDMPITIPNGKTLALAGGVLSTPTLTNAGTVAGSGQISGNFINQATTTFNGLTHLYGTLTNSSTGLITVRNNQLLVTGAAFNSGIIRAVSGGTLAFDGGLSGNPPVPALVPGAPVGGAPIGAAPVAGAIVVDPGGAMVTNYIRQASVSLSSSTSDAAAYARLTIRQKIDGGDTSIINQLAITNNSTLDLADNALLVDYATSSPLATIRSYLRSARGAGAWTSPGLGSSAVATDPGNRAIGYGEASEILHLSGTQTASWQGQTADATSVLVRYTILGDANLDGAAGFADLVAVAQHYDQGGDGIGWSAGDFNYDGAVGFADLVAMAQHYDQVLPSEAFNPDATGALTSIPEPLGLAICGLAIVATTRKRRTRC